jgi:hypothetical protein
MTNQYLECNAAFLEAPIFTDENTIPQCEIMEWCLLNLI